MADQSWMLADVVRVPGVRHALVASADGLIKQRSEGLEAAAAERLAASCAGFNSVAQSVAAEHAASATMRQVMLEMDGCLLFVRSAGDGSHLAVLTDARVDPGLIAQQMSTQVQKIGESNLATPARGTGLGSAGTGP